MAKYLLKRIEYDCFEIDFTKPGTWPIGVQNNAASPTGVSYGTLAVIDLGNGNVRVEGIPIPNMWFLVLSNSNCGCYDPTDFAKKFVIK